MSHPYSPPLSRRGVREGPRVPGLHVDLRKEPAEQRQVVPGGRPGVDDALRLLAVRQQQLELRQEELPLAPVHRALRLILGLGALGTGGRMRFENQARQANGRLPPTIQL